MSFERIKAEFASLTREQRRSLIGRLLALGRKGNADFRQKLWEVMEELNRWPVPIRHGLPILYWIDFADRHVNVLAMTRAD